MSWKELAKIILDFFFIKILGNDIIIVLINIFIPIYLPEAIEKGNNLEKPLIIILIIANIYSLIVKRLQHKKYRNARLYSIAYKNMGEFNKNFAINLYREHKDIIEYIKKGNIIDTNVIKKDTNFQSISFEICNKIYNTIKDYGCDDCLVTIFQRFQIKGTGKSDYVQMIAFSGKSGYQSKSYSDKYSFKKNSQNYGEFSKTVFYRLFNKSYDDELILLRNKKEVKKEFHYLSKSKKREEKICQYIGIGVRTNRDIVEFIVQIDVSKKYVFGYTKSQMKKFVNEVFMPYVNFLYNCYENEMLQKTMYKELHWK